MTQTAFNDRPVSKVLVLDNSPADSDVIKQFCSDNDLIGLKVRKDALLAVLRTNIDLGGVLYSEDYGDTVEETAVIAAQIHATRPELPIVIRRNGTATLDDLPDALRRPFCGAYVSSDMSVLRGIIDQYIFSLIYPNALVRGIAELTESVLASQFPSWMVDRETPHIVRDRLIFGEVFSLIPLESHWCRGYMMLQTKEKPLLGLSAGTSPSIDRDKDFRAVNSLLGELTNLIWGAFKNRYIGDASTSAVGTIQVPLVVNQQHRYISFGTDNPQLCFRYSLTEAAGDRSFTIVQRFVFNLNWSPEDFREVAPESTGLIASGELDLF
jgi:Chemotaxis phosphatase CheX